MAETSPFDTEASLIESLKGMFKGNDKTYLGSAYHKIVEGKFEMSGPFILADDFVFTAEQYAPALLYRNLHPTMQHEVPVNKVYETMYGPIQVTGRLDGIEGAQGRDVKLKFASPDMQEYHDSCQWRFYLDMLMADVFWYDVFEVKQFKQLPVQKPYIIREVAIVPHEPYQCLRYQGMGDDVLQVLNQFLSYIEDRQFHHLLKPAMQHENIIF
jgi:hypothetical protein